MKNYTCSVCGFVYEEAEGYSDDGISAGTKWSDVSSDWVCPVCGASRSEFEEE